MTIINARRNEKGQVELDIRSEAQQFLDLAFIYPCFDVENKPGAWVKKFGHRFPNMKDFKAKHFNHPRVAKKYLGGSTGSK